MTIDEAIQYLSLHATTIELSQDLKLHTAIHLGIEALKRYKSMRFSIYDHYLYLLSGETEK